MGWLVAILIPIVTLVLVEAVGTVYPSLLVVVAHEGTCVIEAVGGTVILHSVVRDLFGCWITLSWPP